MLATKSSSPVTRALLLTTCSLCYIHEKTRCVVTSGVAFQSAMHLISPAKRMEPGQLVRGNAPIVQTQIRNTLFVLHIVCSSLGDGQYCRGNQIDDELIKRFAGLEKTIALFDAADAPLLKNRISADFHKRMADDTRKVSLACQVWIEPIITVVPG